MSATRTRKESAPASNAYLLWSALVAALGGLLFGFDTAVISGSTRALSAQFSLSPAMLGFTVSTALWGTVLRSLFRGPPSDRFRDLGEADPEREVREIAESLMRERAGRREPLFQQRYRKPVFLAISIGMFN